MDGVVRVFMGWGWHFGVRLGLGYLWTEDRLRNHPDIANLLILAPFAFTKFNLKRLRHSKGYSFLANIDVTIESFVFFLLISFLIALLQSITI